MNQDPVRVRRRRVAAGLSKSALAARAGISPNTVTNLERAVFNTRPGTLAAIANALGCEIEDLMPPDPSEVLAGHIAAPDSAIQDQTAA